MNTKVCRECKTSLIVGENWPDHRHRVRNYICKTCYNEKQKPLCAAYRAKNREKAILDTRAWRKNNPEKYAVHLQRGRKKA